MKHVLCDSLADLKINYKYKHSTNNWSLLRANKLYNNKIRNSQKKQKTIYVVLCLFIRIEV